MIYQVPFLILYTQNHQMNELFDKELKEIDQGNRKTPRVFGILFTLSIFVAIIHTLLVLKTSDPHDVIGGSSFLKDVSIIVIFIILAFGLAPLFSLLIALLIALFIYRKRQYAKRLFMAFSVLCLVIELYLLFLTIDELTNSKTIVS